MERSKIAWTDHTFNPWIGCTKVSDGCKFCYAETLMDHRYRKVKWGPQGARVRTSDAYWKKPLQWNKEQWEECVECGWRGPTSDTHVDCPKCDCEELKPTHQRVFCASLADVFEERKDTFMGAWRALLFELIEKTPNLDWLLLTKRPETIESMIPDTWLMSGFPKNVWLGISAESQKEFDGRIPILESIGRRYRPTVIFISAEPLLSPIDMDGWLDEEDLGDEDESCWTRPIDWVIVGGESGTKARPMQIGWVRDLLTQCKQSDVAFFMKQLGGKADKLHTMNDFPEDIRLREFPR